MLVISGNQFFFDVIQMNV